MDSPEPPPEMGMGAGTCQTLAAPARVVGTEVCCVRAGLTLGTGMGAGSDWTPVTPTKGGGMVAGVNCFMAAVTLGAISLAIFC